MQAVSREFQFPAADSANGQIADLIRNESTHPCDDSSVFSLGHRLLTRFNRSYSLFAAGAAGAATGGA
jgi:hypothetical protein